MNPAVLNILLSGYCAPAQAFFARASGLDAKHKRAYDRMIRGLVADGIWSKLDALYIWATVNQATALLNLKSSSFACTTSGTVSFSADNGFTGNATDFFLDSGFNPNAGGGNYLLDSASFGVYILTNRTATTSNKFNFGADNAGAFTLVASINVLDAVGGFRTLKNDATAATDATAGTARGSWGVSRTGASTGSFCRNGAQLGTFVNASVGLPTQTFYFFALHFSGAFGFVDDQMAAGFIGGGLTSAQLNSLSNRINTYMASLPVPINVY